MLLKLFLAFTIIPIAEIYILIKIGTFFGTFTSILLVIITGFVGAYLARIQGLNILFSINESMREGRIPSQELLDALFVAIAGLLLLTPGFITDLVGFILIFQSSRNLIKSWLQNKIIKQKMSTRPEDTIIEQ